MPKELCSRTSVLQVTYNQFDQDNYNLSQLFLFFFFFFVFCLLGAAPTAHGSSQARGCIGAVAAGLHHSHSNAGSEPHLRPAPQLKEMLDP